MARVEPELELECVDLLEMESTAFMYIDGITTMTFFDGPCPLEQLKERLVKLAQATPWIAGKFVKRKGKKLVQMAFHAAPTPELITEKLLHQIDLDISATMPFEAMIAKVKATKAHIKEDGFGLLKKGLPYTRVTVAKKDDKSWALIFSISHTLADGYTYYRALNMLSAKEEIISLNPARHHSFVPNLKEAVGPKVYATYLGAPGLMMNYAGNMLLGSKPRVRVFYLDDDKVKEAKEEAKKRNTTDFVSTNDIVTAFWGRLTRARLVEMSVNFRGRLPDLAPDDAGNYEGCILFSPDDCEDPGNIRKSLQRGDGKFQSTLDPPKPLPGLCELGRCRYRIITNWASFFTELEFDGCTQTLHIPYMNPGSMPTDILVIFKPTHNTLGAYIITRKLDDKTLTAADSLLGKQILPPGT